MRKYLEIFTNLQKGYLSSFIHHLIRWLFTLPAKTYPQFFPLQFLYHYARTKQQAGYHFDLPDGVIANSFVVLMKHVSIHVLQVKTGNKKKQTYANTLGKAKMSKNPELFNICFLALTTDKELESRTLISR